MSQKARVVDLYKTIFLFEGEKSALMLEFWVLVQADFFSPQLLHLGKDWPKGYDFFRDRLKKAFLKNKDVSDPEQIEKMIKHGEYVKKEIEALYMLKKYRTLKRRYEL